MDPIRLPRQCTLFQERGFWMLRWKEEAIGLRSTGKIDSCNQKRIGSATGPDALSESDARRLSRRFLISKLPPGTQAGRALMTISEFIATRFLPEFVAGKSVAGQAHYRSILKLVHSPEQSDRSLGDSSTNGRSGWPYLGNLRLRDVRPHHVQQMLAAASARGYSPQTVRHIRSVVSALFSFAKDELVFMGTNPARCTKPPEVIRKCIPDFTLPQMEQIIRAMRYPEKEMMLLSLLTDMNVSEICGLQWKYVNLTGAWTSYEGESIPPLTIAVQKRWYRGELANAKDTHRRQIQIPETLLSMLLLLNGRTRYREPDDFVLTSRCGAAINVTNITARRLGLIAKGLEIPELTWPLLRRAQATMKEAYGPEFQYRIAAAATTLSTLALSSTSLRTARA
jgi:integrase